MMLNGLYQKEKKKKIGGHLSCRNKFMIFDLHMYVIIVLIAFYNFAVQDIIAHCHASSRRGVLLN